jgi:hypothetical protein
MFTATTGISAFASSAKLSCIRLMPWPVDAVIARTPQPAAPHTMPIASISLSAFMHVPPTSGSRVDMYSRISVEGVMG